MMGKTARFYTWYHRARPLAALLPLAVALLLAACNSAGGGSSGGYKY